MKVCNYTPAEMADRLLAIRSACDPSKNQFLWDRLTEFAAEVRVMRPIAEPMRTAYIELGALIPNPESPSTSDWPCDNPADRECLQKAFVTLQNALTSSLTSNNRGTD